MELSACKGRILRILIQSWSFRRLDLFLEPYVILTLKNPSLNLLDHLMESQPVAKGSDFGVLCCSSNVILSPCLRFRLLTLHTLCLC